jgi:hypothetical protein
MDAITYLDQRAATLRALIAQTEAQLRQLNGGLMEIDYAAEQLRAEAAAENAPESSGDAAAALAAVDAEDEARAMADNE